MNNPTDQFPPGSFETTRAPPGERIVKWTWNNHQYVARVAPVTWGVEKESLRRCSGPNGIDGPEYVEFMLGKIVLECNSPLGGVQLLGQDPDFVWTAAREIGLLMRLRLLGVKLLDDGSPIRVRVEDVLREYLAVEHRLRTRGWKPEDLDAMNREDVQYLLVVDEADRTEAAGKQAAMIAELLQARMGFDALPR